MSGRVWTRHADGTPRRGYRKTTRRQSKPAQYDWTLSFAFPHDMRFLGVSPGDYPGIFGVRVSEIGGVTVTGKSRQWCEEAAKQLIRAVAPDWVGTLLVVYRRDGDVVGTSMMMFQYSGGVQMITGTASREVA